MPTEPDFHRVKLMRQLLIEEMKKLTTKDEVFPVTEKIRVFITEDLTGHSRAQIALALYFLADEVTASVLRPPS